MCNSNKIPQRERSALFTQLDNLTGLCRNILETNQRAREILYDKVIRIFLNLTFAHCCCWLILYDNLVIIFSSAFMLFESEVEMMKVFADRLNNVSFDGWRTCMAKLTTATQGTGDFPSTHCTCFLNYFNLLYP